MDVESTAKELKMLAGRDRLTTPELERAKYLMVQLKEMSVSNPEIMEITEGRWGESTIKGYTKGVRSTDTEPWKSTAAVFSEMLSKDLTLADVSQAMTISAEIEAMGSSLSDILSFMHDLKEKEITLSQIGEALKIKADLEVQGTSPIEIGNFISELEQEKVEVRSLILLLRDWQAVKLTPVDAQSLLGYKAKCEEAGIDIDTLSHITEAAGKFGSPGEVLEAVAKYGNLGQMDEELEAKRRELETLSGNLESRTQELDVIGHKMQDAQDKTATLDETLKTYRSLKSIGFDEKTLGELAKAAEKYSTPRNVLRAINRFGDLSKIRATDDGLRNKIKQKRQMLQTLDEQHAYLKEPIEICKSLLKRKFGLRSLSLINLTAWRYGEPTEIMKAIEAYGALKEIEKKTAEAKDAEVDIRGKIEVQKEMYTDCKARNKEILDQFEVLNAKAIEVGATVGRVQEQLKDSSLTRSLINLLTNPSSASYEEYAPLVLVVMKDIAVWAALNKSKFKYPPLVDKNLQDLIGYLGGT